MTTRTKRASNGNPWSAAEDRLLLKAYKGGEKAKQIAVDIGRSVQAVRQRISRLKTHRPDEIAPVNNYLRWTPEDEKQALAMEATGMPHAKIAEKMKRSTLAVKCRLSDLRASKRIAEDAPAEPDEPTPLKAQPMPTNTPARFNIGDFVLYEFRLHQVARIENGVVRELKGCGYTLGIGQASAERIFPLTLSGFNISQTVEDKYEDLCNKFSGMNINNPGIKPLYVARWQSIMACMENNVPMADSFDDLNTMHVDISAKLRTANNLTVEGVPILRQPARRDF